MNNTEFIEYITVLGMVDEKVNKGYLKALSESQVYFGDYFLKLRKFREDISKLVSLFYWIHLKYKENMGVILDEIVKTLDDCVFYFGSEVTKTYFKNFERLMITNTYNKNKEKLIKEMKIILNPRQVRYDNSVWTVSKNRIIYGIGDCDYLTTLELYDIYSSNAISNVSLMVCKDRKIYLNKLERMNGEFVDPFNKLKYLIDEGLTYDLIGIGARTDNRREDSVREKLKIITDT